MDLNLNKKISHTQFMELINYQELKKEAYLMAIEKLEEEYSSDEEILVFKFKSKIPDY